MGFGFQLWDVVPSTSRRHLNTVVAIGRLGHCRHRRLLPSLTLSLSHSPVARFTGFRVSGVGAFSRGVLCRTAGQLHHHRCLPVALVCLGLGLWGFRCEEADNGGEGVGGFGFKGMAEQTPPLVLFYFPFMLLLILLLF